MKNKKGFSKHLVQENAQPSGALPKVHFHIPDANAPGFLRRQRDALRFAETLKDKDNITSATIDAMADFLLPYITSPNDREAARNALLDMSQAQFEAMLNAITGEKGKARVPLAKSAN